MSRVGKKPIPIPAGVKVSWQSPLLTLQGAKGTHSIRLPEGFSVSQDNGFLILTRPSDEKSDRALHGTYRALIQNAIIGASQGFQKVLEVVGIGYKAELKGSDVLILTLGYSHDIAFVLPAGIKAQIVQERGQNLRIVLESTDKQLIGQVAAMLRSLRPPDPYKGKGIRYSDEVIKLKAGKAKGKGKK
ncbi:MAG: 50S ribosomal protein L6 [Bacteroidia bacterium]|nr:50S ribosomal protein L6 [Bacteroidia bacterium]MCX7652700.1 50S ribosomal protein L6 [Bacteroidia bacterium]MDW8416416.1 50S ribosomal protein L6 [Bacteroidia bacterium]